MDMVQVLYCQLSSAKECRDTATGTVFVFTHTQFLTPRFGSALNEPTTSCGSLRMPPWASQSYGDTAASARKLAGKSLYTLGSTLCSAARTGAAVAKAAAAGIQTLTSHHGDKERVLWARVGQIEWKDPAQGSDRSLPVCLLGYDTGFQVWSLEELKPGGNETPAELVSIRRDGAVR